MKEAAWGCLNCKSRKNPVSSPKCQTCGVQRQFGRYVLWRDDQLFLCKVKAALRFPAVCILNVRDVKQEEVLMDCGGEDLEECVQRTLDKFLRQQHEEHVDGNVPKEITEEKENDKEGSKPFLSPGKSLYDQVLENAASLAYDGKIGQYVNIGTVSAENSEDILTNIRYVHQMKREKAEKSRIVGNIRALAVEQPAERHVIESKRPCPVCEFSFPKSQLIGQITFNSVAQWRKSVGAPVCDENDKRMHFTRLHRPVAICVFCNQFFDEDFGAFLSDNADVEKSVNAEIVDSSIHGAPLTDDDPIFHRPQSSRRFQTAVERLRRKSEMCHLRFQKIGKGGKVIDTACGGRLLRDKYGKQEDVLIEARKNKLKSFRRKKSPEKDAVLTRSDSLPTEAHGCLPALKEGTRRQSLKPPKGSVGHATVNSDHELPKQSLPPIKAPSEDTASKKTPTVELKQKAAKPLVLLVASQGQAISRVEMGLGRLNQPPEVEVSAAIEVWHNCIMQRRRFATNERLPEVGEEGKSLHTQKQNDDSIDCEILISNEEIILEAEAETVPALPTSDGENPDEYSDDFGDYSDEEFEPIESVESCTSAAGKPPSDYFPPLSEERTSLIPVCEMGDWSEFSPSWTLERSENSKSARFQSIRQLSRGTHSLSPLTPSRKPRSVQANRLERLESVEAKPPQPKAIRKKNRSPLFRKQKKKL